MMLFLAIASVLQRGNQDHDRAQSDVPEDAWKSQLPNLLLDTLGFWHCSPSEDFDREKEEPTKPKWNILSLWSFCFVQGK